MNILICTAQVPFTYGGGELHVENLKTAFIEAGYNAEIAAVPFKWYPTVEIMRSTLAWRLLDLTEANGKTIDMVVGMKFPAYLVSHPRKVIWVMHQYRGAYELWQTPFDHLSYYPEGESVRAFIKNADEKFIPEARKVFANSNTVAERLRRYNNIESEPLYHPPPRIDRLHSGEQSDYIFYPSRMEPPKRQELLIEAVRYLKTPLRIIFAGGSPNFENYHSLIKKYKIGDRVEVLGFIEEKKIIELYSNALAVCYLPFDEDYGYVTLEAMYSGKPIIVARDGGGATEFIENGSEGFIVEPEPQAIARALDELYFDRQHARRMGERAREKILSMNLSWQHVVEKLVSAGK
jgi:glycosyltransferase involved in cell wall biosynthesis